MAGADEQDEEEKDEGSSEEHACGKSVGHDLGVELGHVWHPRGGRWSGKVLEHGLGEGVCVVDYAMTD